MDEPTDENGEVDTTLRSPEEAQDKPELFFALVGPIGTDLGDVCGFLEHELTRFGYIAHTIKLSERLHSLRPYEDLRQLEVDRMKIEKHMDAGDDVRNKMKHGGALAALSVAEVKRLRAGINSGSATAYIFRSLKHPDEVRLLREVYGPLLLVVSVYADESKRRESLELRLERRTPSTKERDAHALMQRDEAGGEHSLGQDVRGTFPLADYFLAGDSSVEDEVKRFIRLLFGDFTQSPTRKEYAMAMAHITARRSADLSRQVGAAIMDASGEVLATGCNEVPCPGGGVYWKGDTPDGRDIEKGKDPNAIMGKEILREIFTALHAGGYFSQTYQDKGPEALVDEVRNTEVLKRTRVASLIEFGRVVHAEMNALSHAARCGISVEGAKLYCSTYPCHVCARHLLAAGISEVFYIEPYPKSLAEQLYPDAIQHEGEQEHGKFLIFKPFTGVAPVRYLEWFRFGKRKDGDGFAKKFDPITARPRVTAQNVIHRALEDKLCANLDTALEALEWR